MATRTRLLIFACAALIGGGLVRAGVATEPRPTERPAVTARPASDFHAAGTALLPGEVNPASTAQPRARRPRVKRRRPRVVEGRLPRGQGGGLDGLARSKATDRLLGGRPRAPGRDRAARGLTPAARTARLGHRSTWCTSVPPPPPMRYSVA